MADIEERERPGVDPPNLGLATPLPHSMKVEILNGTYGHPCECELNGHSMCAPALIHVTIGNSFLNRPC